LLLLLTCVRFAGAADEFLPKKLVAFAGNTLVGPYHVELEGDTLFYWRGGPQDKAKAEQIKPPPERWQEFRRELDAIGIWRWHSGYSTRAIYDATGWVFEIEYADRKIKTQGDSSVFPNATGSPVPFGGPHAGDYYRRYVEALRKLLGLYQFPI
jgi:hypothetical protein